MSELSTRIEALALLNAIRHGSAVPGKVISKIIGEFPEIKSDMKSVKPMVLEIVERVNGMPESERLPRLQEIGPDLLEKKEPKKRELPELPNAVQGKVVTRLPPEPSKYNHLGHALTFIINAIYAKRYDGKVILRFEDANPDKVTQEFVDEMTSDITEYMGITPDETRYVSDDMERLIELADQLVNQGDAYMCFCTRDDISVNRRMRQECKCRNNGNHKEEWEKFKQGKYMDGECVLRFKGDMKSKNTVMLDPVLWRAVKAPHFRHGDKYRIWPLYDFYSGIEEDLCGVTHVLRSNEFDLRVEIQERIQDSLGLRNPEVVHYGRFNITGATTKGREIRELIKSGEYIGWDDPRLMTLRALKRRGIKTEAFWSLAEDIGLSPYQVNLHFSMLAAKNRDIIDATSNRYSFIEDPEEITVEGVEPHEVMLNLHPEKKDGGRTIKSSGKYLVSKDDIKLFPGKHVRLMGDFTFKAEDGKYTFVSREMDKKHDVIVNWLSADPDQTVPVEVMMPDATIKEGFAEHGVRDVKVGEIVQFERFGFCRLDVIEDDAYRFWYTHD